MSKTGQVCVCAVLYFGLIATLIGSASAETASPFAIVPGNGRLSIVIDGLPAAVYYYRDNQITRPYFAHVRAPSGVQVTRHQPPIEGQDPLDHPLFHPGIWLAFGDISGADYWRLKAPVRHAGFIGSPQVEPDQATFSVRNEYLSQDDSTKVICQEVARYTFRVRAEGYLLLWHSKFSGDREFAFGDQEEMGLGVRLATTLCVKAKEESVPRGNGTILDAKGRKNGDEVWGNSAAWCDYSGTIADQHVGLTIFCHPSNFRPSWFHARDYGFLAANPFGRQAMKQGEKSSVVVKPGDKLELQYGILIHSCPASEKVDLSAAYDDYLQLSGK